MTALARLRRTVSLAFFICIGAGAWLFYSDSNDAAHGLAPQFFGQSTADFVADWDTRNTSPGSTDNRTIKLPLGGASTDHSFTVSWGDGSSDIVNEIYFLVNSDVRHTYQSPGRYTVTVSLGSGHVRTPKLRGFAFGGNGDRLKLVDIKQWGDVDLGNTGHYFQGAENLEVSAGDKLRKVPSNMYAAFSGAKQFNADVSDWDTSNLSDARFLFNGATSFNRSLNSWNTDKLTQATAMFQGATDFNGSVGDWNTSKLAYMDYMFAGARSFNRPVNSWNTAAALTMEATFLNARAFNQELNSWNTSKVTNMASLFYGCSNFDRPLGSWTTRNVTDLSFMFYGASRFDQPLSGWNTAKARTTSSMFYDAVQFDQPIGTWDTSAVTDMSFMFSGSSAFTQDIGDWNTAKVTSMKATFRGATLFNSDLGNWSLGKVTDTSHMFAGAAAFNQDVSGWTTSNITNMDGMFNSAASFNRGLAAWNISKVTSMRSMFYGAATLNSGDYDSMLISWAQQPTKSNVAFTASGGTQYDSDAAKVARRSLTDSKGWTIVDGGQVPRATITTEAATETTSYSAKLNATIRRMDRPTSGTYFKYSTDRAEIEAGGGTIAYPSTSGNQNAIDGPISADANWLTQNATYYFRIHVNNPAWVAQGDVRQFLAAPAATITQNSPTSITKTSASVSAAVNPQGFPTTAMALRYHTSRAALIAGDGSAVPLTPTSVSGSTAKTVTAALTGLTAGTTYYYELAVSTAAGTARSVGEVTTSPPAGRPIVVVGDPSAVTTSGAKINATVNATGVSTSAITIRYSTNEQTVASGGGSSKVLSPATTASTVATPVSTSLTGLAGATTHYYRISATNSHGTTTTDVASFTTAGRPFISTWNTDFGNGQPSITLPITGSSTDAYDFTVDWGDGSRNNIKAANNAAKTHVYSTGGVKTVTITGKFVGWNGTAFGDRAKLTDIRQWGDLKLGAGSGSDWGFFRDAVNLQISAVDAPDLSATTSLGAMFYGATSFNSPISHWDLSKITSTWLMFYKASAFNQPVGTWNTSNVTSMEDMFNAASSFNQPIGSWNTSNVTLMGSMFEDATAFDQPIGSWNTQKLTDLNRAFLRASSFNQPIGSWDTSKVGSMATMFYKATAFNQPIGGWNTSRVRNMSGMFWDATAFNHSLANWDTSSVSDMNHMFARATSFNQSLSTWNVSSVWGDGAINLLFAAGLSVEAYDATLAGWASQDLQWVTGFGVSGLKYSSTGVSARNALIAKRWPVLGDSLSVPPQVVTETTVQSATPTSLTVSGSVNPRGLAINSRGFWVAQDAAGLTNGTGTYVPVSGPVSGSTTVPMTALVGGLTPDTTYYIQASASDGRTTGRGAVVAYATQALTSPTAAGVSADSVPTRPRSVVGSGGDGVGLVSWEPGQDGGALVSQFTVTVTPSDTGTFGQNVASVIGSDSASTLTDVRTCTATGEQSSCLVTGLTNGSSYTATVTATNAHGTSSESETSEAFIPNPVAPPSPVIESVTAADRSVTVSVRPGVGPGAAMTYTVRVSPSGRECVISVPATSCVVDGLTNGVNVTATAIAANLTGPSAASAPSDPVRVGATQQVLSLAQTPTGLTVDGPPVPLEVASNALGAPITATSTTLDTCTVSALTVTGVGVGPCVLSVNAGAVGGYSEAAPLGITLSVAPGVQTVTFGSLPSFLEVGAESVPISAASTAPGATITLSSVDTNICTIDNAKVSPHAAGTCVINAVSVASAGYSDGRAWATISIGIRPQTISFQDPPTAMRIGETRSVAAQSNAAGATLTLSSASDGVCNVAGHHITATGPGTCVITASAPAIGTFGAGTSGIRFQVDLRTQTVTFGNAPGPLNAGDDPAQIAVSSDAPGASVQLTSSSESTCTVDGLTVTPVGAGTCELRAESPAVGNFGAADPASLSFPIGVGTQTLSFGAAPAGARLGADPVTTSVTSNAPNAEITVTSETPSICSVESNSVAFESVGTCTLRARSEATAEFGAATDVTQSFPILPRLQTLTFGPSPTGTRIGQTANLTITSNATNATITATSTTPTICTITGTTVTALAAGDCQVTATAPAVDDYESANEVGQQFTVRPRLQTLTFGPSPTGTRIGQTANLTITSNATNATITATSTTPIICTITGTTVTALAAGDCQVTATAPAVDDYESANEVITQLTIGLREQTLSFGPIINQLHSGETATITALSNAPGATVTYETSTPERCTIQGEELKAIAPGGCKFVARSAGTGEFGQAAEIGRTVSVVPRKQTLTFGPAPDGLVAQGVPDQISVNSDAPNANVILESATPAICRVEGNNIFGLVVGECVLRANASATDDFGPALEVGQAFRIGGMPQELSLEGSAPSLVVGGSTSELVVKSNAQGASVALSSATPSICAVTGSTVSPIAAGACLINASSAATDLFNSSALLPIALTVTKGAQSLSWVTNPSGMTVGDPTSRIQASSNAPGARITYTSGTPTVCALRGTDLRAIAAGRCEVRATANATANFNEAAAIVVELSIAPATPDLVAPPSPEAPSIANISIGNQSATISVRSGDGGAPETIKVTAHPGAATCTIAHPETTCTILGLRNGISYKFTSESINGGGTSAHSELSNAVVPDRKAILNLQLSGVGRSTVVGRPIALAVRLSDPESTGTRASIPTASNTNGTAVISANGRPVCSVEIRNGAGKCRHTPRKKRAVTYTATFKGSIHEQAGTSSASASASKTSKLRHVTIGKATVAEYRCTKYIRASGKTLPHKLVTLKILKSGKLYHLGKARADRKGRWTVVALMHPGMADRVWAGISGKKRSEKVRYVQRNPSGSCARTQLPSVGNTTVPPFPDSIWDSPSQGS